MSTPHAELSAALKEQLQPLVLRELDLFRRTALNTLAGTDLRAEAKQAIETILASGAIRLPPSIDFNSFVQEMAAEIMGYGPIEPYLHDDSISEVMVNGPNRIYVERDGLLSAVPARFISAESLMRVIERIVAPLGRRIDEGVPMVDGRLPDGSRVNAIIPPLRRPALLHGEARGHRRADRRDGRVSESLRPVSEEHHRLGWHRHGQDDLS